MHDLGVQFWLHSFLKLIQSIPKYLAKFTAHDFGWMDIISHVCDVINLHLIATL